VARPGVRSRRRPSLSDPQAEEADAIGTPRATIAGSRSVTVRRSSGTEGGRAAAAADAARAPSMTSGRARSA
jgi:hypothetical protein